MQRMPSVVLDRGQYTTLTIKLDGGGAITSWRINNQEQIFVSKLSKFTAYDEVKGGIKLVFPKIGKWEFGPTNGFKTCWHIKKQPYEKDNGDISIDLSMNNDALTESYKNFKFEIGLEVILSESSFTLKSNVINNSKVSTYIETLTDCYFKVIDSRKCKIGSNNTKKDEDEDICKLDDAPKENVLMCMDNCPNDCHILCPMPICIEGLVNNNTLMINATNFFYDDFSAINENDNFAEDEQYKYIRFRTRETKSFKLLSKQCFCSHVTFEVKTPSLMETAIKQYMIFIEQNC